MLDRIARLMTSAVLFRVDHRKHLKHSETATATPRSKASVSRALLCFSLCLITTILGLYNDLVFFQLAKDQFPYSSEQLPGAKETQKQLSDVELFIPIPPIDDAMKEYLDIVVPSFKLFWPMDELKIFFLTDKEKGPDVIQPFSEKLKALLPGAAQIRVDSNMPPFEIEGAGSVQTD